MFGFRTAYDRKIQNHWCSKCNYGPPHHGPHPTPPHHGPHPTPPHHGPPDTSSSRSPPDTSSSRSPPDTSSSRSEPVALLLAGPRPAM